MKNNNKGFSLVELIVVIAIMAILAAIAIPTFAHFITKANEASDAELLNNINYIFNAACVENGVDVKDVTSATWDKEQKLVTEVKVNGVPNAKIVESFELHFGEMKNEEFKYITDLYFDPAKHEFVEGRTLSVQGNDGKTYYYVADSEQANALAGSIFMTGMGIEKTLDIMDKVADFATVIESESLGIVMADPSFIKAYCEYLGITYDPNQTPEDFYDQLTNTYGEEKAEDMTANALILYTTDSSNTLSTENVKDLLGQAGAKDKILDNLEENPAEAMAQTAAAYSLYMGYLHTLPESDERDRLIEEATENPTVVLTALEDEGFQAYIMGADADIDGYLAAMGMMSDASGTSNGKGGTAAGDLLTDGFKNTWLPELMDQAVGN